MGTKSYMQLTLWHRKNPQLPLGKSQAPKSLWYGTNRTSRPQQETLD